MKVDITTEELMELVTKFNEQQKEIERLKQELRDKNSSIIGGGCFGSIQPGLSEIIKGKHNLDLGLPRFPQPQQPLLTPNNPNLNFPYNNPITF